MYLFKTPKIIKWYYPNLIWNGNRDKSIIYLTFDDGPVPGVTDHILDSLGLFKIKATFFCVGENIEKHPHLFRRIYKEGHLIGNHTYHHLNGWNQSMRDYLTDIQQCSRVIGNNGYSSGDEIFSPTLWKNKKNSD